jgi:REP element-mobilizing transposase RayT
LHHLVPDWVESGAIFHIRVAIDRTKRQLSLVSSPLVESLMESARFYEARHRWYLTAFLLMPDHLHALLSFERDKPMSRVIGDWKHFQTYQHGIIWQEGYFDHRLRDDERGEQLAARINYVRQNPVAAGLVAKAEDWPWWIERSALDG